MKQVAHAAVAEKADRRLLHSGVLSIAYIYFYLNFLLIVCKVTEVLMHFHSKFNVPGNVMSGITLLHTVLSYYMAISRRGNFGGSRRSSQYICMF